MLSKAPRLASPVLPLGLRASPNSASGTFQPSHPPCKSVTYPLCSARLVWSLQPSDHLHILSSALVCPALSPSLRRSLLSTYYGQSLIPGNTSRRKHSPQNKWLSSSLTFHLLQTLFLLIFQNIHCLYRDFWHLGFPISFSVCSM